MPTTPTTLPDELLEEIFLRLPPDEPEHLVRASLASKLWLGLLSGARFRGLYRDFHGAPPMLGFLYNWLFYGGPKEDDPVANFVPTAKFGALVPDGDGWDREYTPWDCRHGRVLLGNNGDLVVWEPPMTGCRRELHAPDLVDNSFGAAVLCAVSGCDHRACHGGPFQFQVVFIGLDKTEVGDCVASACVSLPATGDLSKPSAASHFDKWGEPCSGLHLDYDAVIDDMPPVLVQDALHFKLGYDDDDRVGILKYDLSSNCLSLIDALLVGFVITGTAILMAMEDGTLGFADVDKYTLHLCSRQMGSDGVASWTQPTVIDLNNLLPIQNPNERLRLVGSVEGSDIIFVNMGLDIYEINLKTLRWKKLQKRQQLRGLIPYMSFYSPQERVIPGDAAH